ncbi:Phosphoglycolate phosphatase [Fundidesulfovibrio magnetotacticus]|uniref:phosphoglycolate phosphatase n=1 Tax=Fundidesulfovibrio magnetotacticus TaxID=2730080 RepID=A0A6V8LY41_9BACT|nr:HAD-IA family hydrolase [Fundidesulfovibrio magnetotacticus]GFK94567.1 Phosphoglycolate phosphatase [Fundidesulfovibrio magnetotacticus]
MRARKVEPTLVPQGVKGVIFDCDGVLVDSKDSNRMFYNIIRGRLGMLPMTPEEEDFVHANAVFISIAHIVPQERLAEAEAARKEIDYSELIPFTFLEPGLTEFLDTLREWGVRLGVNTNRTNSMEMLLENFELTDYFFPVVTAGNVKHPKPNPEGVHRILREWNLTRHDVAFIGDSDVDEATARAAGVPFWAYKNPSLAAHLHVSSFEALREGFRMRLERA